VSHATLCVLSFNRAAFLHQCIESAINSTDEELEIIVHDDGSKDPDVYEVLDVFREHHQVSTAIFNPPGNNQGQGTALNRMFGMATGDPIIKCDQDIVFWPGWTEKMRRVLSQPRVGLLGFFKYWHEPVDWRKTVIPNVILGQHSYELPIGFSYHTHICGSAFAVPRHVWDQLGPFTEHSDAFSEDWEFQKKVHASGRWMNALNDEDLVGNQGFGIGPSTVVLEGHKVQKINHGPRLVRGRA
jgi:glycosyltransferase involved in cell wall biosynthesis